MVELDELFEPSGLTTSWVREVLSVPAGGATISGVGMPGATVVVLCVVVVCAMAGTASSSAAAAISSDIFI